MKSCIQVFIIGGILTTSFHGARGDNKELKNNICRDEDAVHNVFSITDYSVVGTMLLISCAVGTFYGFFGKKQETSTDFLLGGSKMGTVPMSLSLAAR